MRKGVRNIPTSSSHICECGKSYKYRQGLFSHRKRCDTSSQTTTDTSAVATDTQPLPPHFDAALVIELLKQNQEFNTIMLEQSKQLVEQHSQMTEHQNQLLEAVKCLRVDKSSALTI